mmetsp:Transcript_10970/g.28783  ORF Transcript_10970/g.28783 Transcript_10970/m.28783 type:complete len:487 (+) Transcript_10970:163-1623(+)
MGEKLYLHVGGLSCVDLTLTNSEVLPSPTGHANAEDVINSAGGITSNVARTAASIGVGAIIHTRLGDDQQGAFLKAEWEKYGADTSAVRTEKEETTGLCVMAMYKDGQRGNYFVSGTNTTMTPIDVLPSLSPSPSFHASVEVSEIRSRAPLTCILGYPHILPRCRGSELGEAMGRVRSELVNCMFAVDLNAAGAGEKEALEKRVESFVAMPISKAMVVHCNFDEAKAMAGARADHLLSKEKKRKSEREDGIESVKVEKWKEEWAKWDEASASVSDVKWIAEFGILSKGAAMAVVTLGKRGAVLVFSPAANRAESTFPQLVRRVVHADRHSSLPSQHATPCWQPIFVRGLPVIVRSTVGAGDAFLTGFCATTQCLCEVLFRSERERGGITSTWKAYSGEKTNAHTWYRDVMHCAVAIGQYIASVQIERGPNGSGVSSHPDLMQALRTVLSKYASASVDEWTSLLFGFRQLYTSATEKAGREGDEDCK